MESNKLKTIVEVLIIVSGEPLSVNALTLLLEPDGVTKADIESVISELQSKYNGDLNGGLILNEVANGWQFRTRPELSAYIQRLDMPRPSKLSQAALETMAIIAYKQPIVRSEIEEIRGVDSGGVIKTLLDRNLIKIVGKRDEAGNPLIYATTSKFLEIFSLGSLKELPTLREYEELEKEHYKGALIPAEEEKPLLDGVSTEPLSVKWNEEDNSLIDDLTDNIKRLRRLEKDIFPKPVETIVAVPNADPNQPGENNADTSPENIGTGD